MRKIKNSLTAKIFLLTVSLLILVSMLTYACVSNFLPVTYRNELEKNLQNASEELVRQLAHYESPEEAENLLELFAAGNQAGINLLDEKGEIIFPSGTSETVYENIVLYGDSVTEAGDALSGSVTEADDALSGSVTEEGDALSGSVTEAGDALSGSVTEAGDALSGSVTEAGDALRGSVTEAGDSQSAMKSYPVKIGKRPYTLLVSGSMQTVSQTMEILRKILPLISAVIFAIAVVCAVWASVYLTRPVRRISAVSQKMADLHFEERCREKRTDEIGVLAGSLNTLADNLQASLGRLQDANLRLKSDMEKEREEERKRSAFFSAASHELKTPVTILKGHLGGMISSVGAYRDRDYYLQRSYQVTETMESLVREILAVSRMESGAWEAEKEKLNLAELLRLRIAELIGLFEEKALQLRITVPQSLVWNADRAMMEKVFGNLLMNAVRYSPEHASVHVFMKEENGMLFFFIENSGAHIPEASLPHLFEAFYRVDDSRNSRLGGSGLGLYIVRMILEQHDGVCGAENSRGGVRVWFRLNPDTERTENA